MVPHMLSKGSSGNGQLSTKEKRRREKKKGEGEEVQRGENQTCSLLLGFSIPLFFLFFFFISLLRAFDWVTTLLQS